MRRLSALHNWKTRAAAFDHHRATAASRALDELLQNDVTDCKERARRFRDQTWLLHEEILSAALLITKELKKHPRRATLNDVGKLYNLASMLGRRSVGMPIDPDSAVESEDHAKPRNLEADAALLKIYGPDAEKPDAESR